MKKNLALDIGGTNFRVALLIIDGKKINIVKKVCYKTDKVRDISKIIDEYKTKDVCISAAGPVKNNKVELTNVKLVIDAKSLREKTKKRIFLVNDFFAATAGIDYLNKKDFFPLNISHERKKIMLIIGPGTGLGMGVNIDSKIYPTESGHTDFCVESKKDFELFEYIKNKKKGVYYEDLLSGNGLVTIYSKFKKINSKINPEIITGFAEHDVLFDKTIKEFVKIYARFARNSALVFLPSHIFLIGKITNSMHPYIKKGFMKEFIRHELYEKLLVRINVSVILNEDIGLIGAGAIAAGLIEI